MRIPIEKPLFILRGEIRTSPMGNEVRQKVGFYLREVQQGVNLTMPLSRLMPQIQHGCHELSIKDNANRLEWRIIYYIDEVAILVLGVLRRRPIKRQRMKRRLFEMHSKDTSMQEDKGR